MKLVQFSAFGIPYEVAKCIEVPELGPPDDDEVVIQIEAFPINPVDLLTLEGRYAVRPALPAAVGSESVGRIAAVGAAVGHLQVGDRVINMDRDNWAQQRKVKAARAIKMPEGVDVLQLAMLKVNPATARLMLRDYVALQAGDWVIQDAANSGVGQNLIRLAKADGIRTVNIVRREELIEPLKAIGADAVVVDGPDLVEAVRAETEGTAKLAIDAVAGPATLRIADCLADGGTVVNYGLLSGEPCMLGSHHAVFRGITLTGFWLVRSLGAMAPEEILALYGDLAGRIAAGDLRVKVEATYPIEEIEAALRHASGSGRSGKVLVTPNGPVG
jgi:NADPH:quinone reductase-like Zn-dependent oxidoreductase